MRVCVSHLELPSCQACSSVDTSCIWDVLYCAKNESKVPSAADIHAVTNIYQRAARALFDPAHTWISSCLFHNKQPNSVEFCLCASVSQMQTNLLKRINSFMLVIGIV